VLRMCISMLTATGVMHGSPEHPLALWLAHSQAVAPILIAAVTHRVHPAALATQAAAKVWHAAAPRRRLRPVPPAGPLRLDRLDC
jgi:hypothetical protein